LPESDWTWAVVRSNLTELCEAAGKSMSWLLKTLHTRTLEQTATLRKIIEEGERSIHVQYILRDGETERLLLYHARIQNRCAKWIGLLGQSKADRLGLTLVQPIESLNGGSNGDQE
jgi:hypothetical protein